jgi:N-acetylmuramoyl-L-alanine amidase
VDAENHYNADELYWLSRIIEAEAGGELLEGKIAVGNVVLNRVADKRYPNSIYGVIFDFKNGIQFTPAYTGTIYNKPSQDSIIAAKMCLEGYEIVPGVLFFFNPRIATSIPRQPQR